jgi:hypothetical protein
VVRSAFRKAQTVNRVGTRGVRLAGDAIGALRGKPKVDERGRPLKREWQKTWFRNAVVNTGLAGATLGGAAFLRKNPKLRRKIGQKAEQAGGAALRTVKTGLRRAGQAVSDLTDIDRRLEAEFRIADSRSRIVQLDLPAALAGWDVRDPRGRSARVYAPGSRPRERREKHWHERIDNIRKIAVGAGLAALAGGVAGGYALGKRRGAGSPVSAAKTVGLRKASTAKGNVIYPAGMKKM